MSCYRQFISILSISAYLISCTSASKTPEDFSFVIKDELDSYDSKTSLFTRAYVGKDTVIRVPLDSTELSQIYTAFVEYDFANFPKEFTGFPLQIPAFTTTITFRRRNELKTCSHTSDTEHPLSQRRYEVKFNQLEEIVWTILRNKGSVKSLHQSNMMFL